MTTITRPTSIASSLSIVAALAVGPLLGPTRSVAQAAKPIADGVFLLPDRGGPSAGWVDLGSDVLAIIGGPSGTQLAAIKRLSRKPVRARVPEPDSRTPKHR